MIAVKKAYANNLKNISVDIPIGKITAITGVSGSGKSTLLKDILGGYGALNFTRIAPKTVQDSLRIANSVDVETVENLPTTIFIDVKNSVSNPMSTVSTVSGIHGLLRNIFSEHGTIKCPKCGKEIHRDYSLIKHLVADLRIDETFDEALKYIEWKGRIFKIDYFDKNGNITVNDKKKAFSTVYFFFNNIDKKLIEEFNKKFNCSIFVISDTAKTKYDFVKEIECPSCHSICANLIRSRTSYNIPYEDGGGACRHCKGTGKIAKIKIEKLFQDTSLSILGGASPFINAKGIRYTTVTEKFIEALYQYLNINVNAPVSSLSEKELNALIYGIEKNISFMDRVGGKKNLIFEGINAYLEKSYRQHKGGDLLANLFEENICPCCSGTRFDISVSFFKFCNESIKSLMAMSLTELGDWFKDKIKTSPKKICGIIEKITKEIDIFNLLSCGHLNLCRYSYSLSGGEIQRIRIGALLNSNVHGLCYLLDEPASGLHYKDIENLSCLLRRICKQGNTVIMTEHNKKMLSCCDYIIELGPQGGSRGGNVVFKSAMSDIKGQNSPADRIKVEKNKSQKTVFQEEKKDFLTFENLSINNLKNISVRFPLNSCTTVCGVSGSGKSTFVTDVVYSAINNNPSKYGFECVDYLGQKNIIVSKHSTVASIIKISEYIARLYEVASNGKIKKSSFLLGSSDGKCQYCGGMGRLYTESHECIGICDKCGGHGFASDILNIYLDGLNIYEIYNKNIEDLADVVKEKKLKKMLELGIRLGVGYLALSRQSKTLSKGELQRVSLIQKMMGVEKNHLIILDEPSKGLHDSDTIKLIDAIKDITMSGNTVLTVEHNPLMIKKSDYVIELGGTGVNGGYLLFQGIPANMKDTPTSNMLDEFELGKIPLFAEKENYAEKEILITYNDTILKYKPYHIYQEKHKADFLEKCAKKSMEDFFNVSIPGNSMFSIHNRTLIESDTPIIFTIDFNERIKYNIPIGEALGLFQILNEEAVYENGDIILKYVFNPLSLTGKCEACKGKGIIQAVDESFFMVDGNLSQPCKKFLKNSTNYLKLSKEMKKERVDISKVFMDMSGVEKTILFWGYDKIYNIGGKLERWEGIIPYFLRFHNYYADKMTETIFKQKKDITCPICNGAGLKALYVNYKSFGLSFMEWMSLDVDTLLKKLSLYTQNDFSIIKKYLESLHCLGVGNISLSSELVSLPANVAAKIKLLSFLFNRIYGVGIIVKHIEMSGNIDSVNQILKKISDTSTVWII